MRARLVIREGRCRWVLDRRPLATAWYMYTVPRGRFIWRLAARRNWGTTIVQVTEQGMVVWEHPSFVVYEDLRVMKKKRKAAETSDAQHLASVESVLFGRLHSLVAHCGVTKYDDGDTRKPGWWVVKTMGSAWVVEVKDPDTCCRLVVVQQTLDEALTLAALLLESEEAPWEPDPWLQQSAARARKK